jgi:hypothetical protein
MRRLVLVVTATLVALVLSAPGVRAQAGCQTVKGEIHLTFSLPEGWIGQAWLDIGGVPYQAQVSQGEGGESRVTDDGNIHGIEEIVFTFEPGVFFKERDKFTFGPSDEDPGEWHFTGVGRIIEGTGTFEQAYGKLVFVGSATGPTFPFPPYFPTVFTGSVKGRVCDIAD